MVPETEQFDVDRKLLEIVVRSSDERCISFVSQGNRVSVREREMAISLQLARESANGAPDRSKRW